jgi:hypothetical protein
MKKPVRLSIIMGMVLILVLISAALSSLTPPPTQINFRSDAFYQPATTTPQVEDISEIGSTDGIVVLGGIIVLIVIMPIFLYRKSWMQSQ